MAVLTVRTRQLIAELRHLRAVSGLTLEDVAEKTGIPTSKGSRIEAGRLGVKPADLDALLNVYGVEDEDRRAALHSMARHRSVRGWWQPYREVISPAYADLISLEAEAESMRTFEALLVPGLLQTAAYAHATIDALNMTMTSERVNALTEVRMARQSVLTTRESQPLELWAIIHEAALRPRFLNRPTVMRDQLQRLLDLQERPNISIQVLALGTAPHPGMVGSFAVLSFPEATSDLDVVLVESLTSALYVENSTEVGVYGGAFERLRAAALPFDSSADLIARLKDEIK
jgi:transcriptional regulator with XRE-family HTH domain